MYVFIIYYYILIILLLLKSSILFSCRRWKTRVYPEAVLFNKKKIYILQILEMKFSTGVKNNHMQGTVSQNFFIEALVLILCRKTGNFYYFFQTLFSRLHKMRTRA